MLVIWTAPGGYPSDVDTDTVVENLRFEITSSEPPVVIMEVHGREDELVRGNALSLKSDDEQLGVQSKQRVLCDSKNMSGTMSPPERMVGFLSPRMQSCYNESEELGRTSMLATD